MLLSRVCHATRVEISRLAVETDHHTFTITLQNLKECNSVKHLFTLYLKVICKKTYKTWIGALMKCMRQF